MPDPRTCRSKGSPFCRGDRTAVHALVEVAVRDRLRRELPPGGRGRQAVEELQASHGYLAAPAT
jgi:hypothetical protein